MKNKKNRVRTWLFGGLLAAAVTAAFLTACNNSAGENPAAVENYDTESTAGTERQNETQKMEKMTVLGEGAQVFSFSVIDAEGTENWFEIHTDAETVGEALTENGLLEGEDGPYGLYVKTVNGITADYDKDKVYWAFYVNDEYAMSGVDQTKITEGDIYSFRIEK